MRNTRQALQRGESVRERRLLLARAHERFVADDSLIADEESRNTFATQSELRPVVLDSWLRARRRAVDPNRTPGQGLLSLEELEELQRFHPIARVLPVINRLLLDEATQAGFVVAVGDAAGRILWIDGDRSLRSEAEDMGFAVGTDWSEDAVGTSAPGQRCCSTNPSRCSARSTTTGPCTSGAAQRFPYTNQRRARSSA